MRNTNPFYNILTKQETQAIQEQIYVQPSDSYETIISAVNYALAKNDTIEDLVDEIKDELKECDVETSVQPMLYPFVIATYPTFCLFDLGPKTFKALYTYDNTNKIVTLGTITEVIIDIAISDKEKIVPDTEDE